MGAPDQKLIPPPPGFMKRNFVETSQGMKIVPIQKQSNPIAGGNDNSKKKKKQSKKKNQEKSVMVNYYGEKLTLSMGVDAKDNQVT